MNKIHFISGLPRAGSTPLAAVLRQNPRFTASFRSPIEDILHRYRRAASGEFSQMLKDKSADICRAIIHAYYRDADVAFDTNRGWMLRDSLLKELFPGYKMILCVRDTAEIYNSFEILHKSNPLMTTAMYDEQFTDDVFKRMTPLMAENGLVMAPYRAMQQYLAAVEDKPFIMEYDDFAKNPLGTMKAIYKYLDEEYYPHDFNNLEQIPGAEEYDLLMRTPGLHTVGKEVYPRDDDIILPETVLEGIKKVHPMGNFWQKKKKKAE